MKSPSYNEKSIKILSTMQSLQKKMGMYLGSDSSDALFQILKEVVDNAVDEFLQGRGNHIKIDITKDTVITVLDNANGIPVSIIKEPESGRKINSLTAVFTRLHAGGKFDSKAYAKGSKGTHGIGVTATNAVSKFLSVWTVYKGTCWHQSFNLGEPKADVKKGTMPKFKGKAAKVGTLVQFQPEFSLFKKNSKLDIKKVQEYLELLSYIHSGLTIDLFTEGKHTVYKQKDGLKALLELHMKQKEVEPFGKVLTFHRDGVDIALQWSDYTDENVMSYVNGSFTRDGGTHVRGLLEALNKSLEPFRGKKAFAPQDLRSGLMVVLNVSVVEPKFSSQTKEKLTSEGTVKQVFEIAKPQFDAFFKGNKSFVQQLLKRAESMQKLREQFTANKKAASTLKSAKGKFALSSKLAACESKQYDKCELYIVEGDSAGGTAKQARDRNFQAVLPLRGKPLNAYGPSSAKLMQNKEVLDLLRAIGYEGDAKASKLKFGKIIILADADVDGKHITVLVMSILQRILPEVFKQGMVYTVDSPLYIARLKSGLVGANTLEQIKTAMGKEKGRITRLKGWGEAKPEELEQLAFNVAKRRLIKVTPLVSNGELAEYVNTVGESPATKRKLLGIETQA